MRHSRFDDGTETACARAFRAAAAELGMRLNRTHCCALLAPKRPKPPTALPHTSAAVAVPSANALCSLTPLARGGDFLAVF